MYKLVKAAVKRDRDSSAWSTSSEKKTNRSKKANKPSAPAPHQDQPLFSPPPPIAPTIMQYGNPSSTQGTEKSVHLSTSLMIRHAKGASDSEVIQSLYDWVDNHPCPACVYPMYSVALLLTAAGLVREGDTCCTSRLNCFVKVDNREFSTLVYPNQVRWTPPSGFGSNRIVVSFDAEMRATNRRCITIHEAFTGALKRGNDMRSLSDALGTRVTEGGFVTIALPV